MKKGFKIFGIVLLVIIAFSLIAYYGLMLISKKLRGTPTVSVSIERHYNSNEEMKLIDSAEQMDCDLSKTDSKFVNNFEDVCVKKSDLDSYLLKEAEIKVAKNNSSSFIVEYDAYVDVNNAWPGDTDSEDEVMLHAWFQPLVLDKNSNPTTADSCLNKVGSNYWLVLQQIDTVSGRPDKLAGSGTNGKRYLLFDKNKEFVCQYLQTSSWIN